MITYTLKVADIIRETEDTCTICFKQPGLKKIKYTPGQYVTVVVNINGRRYKRPYSISSAPGIDNTVNITVKRLLHGVVSNHLVDVVKIDDVLEVIEPMGNFVYKADTDSSKQVYLWGAGSGITPLMSILKTALQHNENKVHLIYGNKSINQTIFYKQLLVLRQAYPERFTLDLFFTEQQGNDVRFGRIGAEHVKQVLSGNNNLSDTLHYICGPVGLKDTIKTIMTDWCLPSENLFSEDFDHPINQEELKDVQTRFVQINKDHQQSTVEVVKGKSILEACLDYGFDLPYSCQNGTCTLCKAKLLSGAVKRIAMQKADKEIAENEELLCCSYPLTDNIIFEII